MIHHRWLAPICCVIASCATTPPRQASSLDPIASATEPSAGMPAADAGASSICTHDTKDLAPCEAECDRGIASACTIIAQRIERGEGVPKNLTFALKLHEHGCELRDAPSCVSAARMYASGSGVPPNRGKQMELLATACTLGDETSCSVPAKAFANGSGVPRDERRANDLWQRACSAGIGSACDELEPGAP